MDAGWRRLGRENLAWCSAPHPQRRAREGPRPSAAAAEALRSPARPQLHGEQPPAAGASQETGETLPGRRWCCTSWVPLARHPPIKPVPAKLVMAFGDKAFHGKKKTRACDGELRVGVRSLATPCSPGHAAAGAGRGWVLHSHPRASL